MALMKLENVDAFVVRDLDDDTPAIGIVRSAPKILQGGAKELARSQTYQCAIFNMKCQGGSAGINAAPDARDAAAAGFVEELLPLATSGALMLDAGKGITDDQIAGLFAVDPRNDAARRSVDGVSNHRHLTGLGAVAAAEAARALDGQRIAIEQFETVGPSVARAAVERGAKVTAVSTAAGAAFNADGFDVAALIDALAADGPGFVTALSDDETPGWRVLGAECDVLFAGSKMGLIDHKGAENVTASMLVPTGPIPYTTKGVLVLERGDTQVLPDIVTTAGPMIAGMPPSGDDQASIEHAVTELVGTLSSQVISGDDMATLDACKRAEAFLRTWRDELPFGRPFAA